MLLLSHFGGIRLIDILADPSLRVLGDEDVLLGVFHLQGLEQAVLAHEEGDAVSFELVDHGELLSKIGGESVPEGNIDGIYGQGERVGSIGLVANFLRVTLEVALAVEDDAVPVSG